VNPSLSLAEIGQRLQARVADPASVDPDQLLALAEIVLEHWIVARGKTPTTDEREGFRLLALHRQGADGEPSFNACRETCREVAYHYNLLTQQPDHAERPQRQHMMALVTNHLYLFISGKMETRQLGEFCCSSRPVRQTLDAAGTTGSE
jgi:hypothetical protein